MFRRMGPIRKPVYSIQTRDRAKRGKILSQNKRVYDKLAFHNSMCRWSHLTSSSAWVGGGPAITHATASVTFVKKPYARALGTRGFFFYWILDSGFWILDSGLYSGFWALDFLSVSKSVQPAHMGFRNECTRLSSRLNLSA